MEVESTSHEVPSLLSKQEIQSEKITVSLDPVIPSVSSDLSSSSLKRQIQKSQEDNSAPKKLNASRIIPDTVLNNRYTKSCQGPFEIVITSTGAANTSIHPLTVGRLLSSTLKKDIAEIKKLGFSKISAQFKSREAANNLINNPILNANNLIAYIPSYRVSRQGIIRNVPLVLAESTIKEEIDCSVGINSVRRLNRKVIDSSTRSVSYAPSKSIAIIFEGQDIPQFLYLYMVRSNPSFSNYLNMKKSEAIIKRTLQSAKRKGWRNFCSILNDHTPIQQLWKMIKRFKSRHLGLPSFQNSSNLEIPEDFPNPSSCNMFDKPFTISELISHIKNLKTKSSPGPDRIDYKMISLLPDQYLPILLDILNNIFEEGNFPDSWQQSIIFLIPKNSPGKFRPISLTSCLLKLTEKLIHSRLEWWMEKNKILPSRQFGFRKRKSCHDNLGALLTDIYTGFALNQPTVCLFLDIVGAFDNVVPNILIEDLIELGLPSKLCQFIYNLIHVRKLQFVINGEITNTLISYRGVPQGSILSPLLFNIYISKCQSILNNKCEILQFADDIAIFARSSNIDRSLQTLEQAANKLAAHLVSKDLAISPTKSALMVFSRRRKSPLFYSINLQDSVITSSTSHKFLGIILDPKLHGNLHIEFLSKKCTKLLNILKSLRGVWWGANPVLLLNIYKALIRGSIEYSFPYIRSNNFTHLEKLEKIQKQAIRLCLGLRQTTPSNVLLAESGIGSLRYRLIYLASKFLLKSFASNDNLVIDKLFNLQISLINNNKFDISTNFILYSSFFKLKLYKSKIASFDQLPVYNHDFETTLVTADIHITPPAIVEKIRQAPFPQLIFMATYNHLIQERKCFFTDASKTDSQDYIGLAFYSHSPHTSRQYRIDGYASIFTGETFALLKCLDYILQNKITNSSIFTDSRSLVEILLSVKPLRDLNYLIFEIKERLRSAYLSNYNISIIWIPSHSGILGNETADLFAKRAIRTGELVSELIPHCDFYSLARTHYISSTNRTLIAQANLKGKHYFNLNPFFLPRPWFIKLGVAREEIVTACRIRSNHYNLQASLFRCHITSSSACDCGHPSQDIDHTLWFCPLYQNHRPHMLKNLKEKTKKPSPLDIFKLLSTSSAGIISCLATFFKKYKGSEPEFNDSNMTASTQKTIPTGQNETSEIVSNISTLENNLSNMQDVASIYEVPDDDYGYWYSDNSNASEDLPFHTINWDLENSQNISREKPSEDICTLLNASNVWNVIDVCNTIFEKYLRVRKP
ncbi:uncharacterized protein [Polyergus mexicanus]|uniref:uncharacterized protein n=1 Tax=Polyergus mexicanus TaxID=615972 RepID=UPI0038B55DE0